MPLCKYCFAHIQWVTRDGLNVPLDPDGSDHRDTCNPQNSSRSMCKFCFAQIQWVKRDGKNIPLDPDGTDHRDSCTPPQSTPSKKRKWANYSSHLKRRLNA